MLPTATDGIDPKYIEHEEDIISYVILPEPALQFFIWRALPPEQRSETPADLEIKKMRAEEEKTPAAIQQVSAAESAPVDRPGELTLPDDVPDVAAELIQKIDGLTLEELVFRKGDYTIAVRPSGVPASASVPPTAAVKSTPAGASVRVSAKTIDEKSPEAEKESGELEADTGSDGYPKTIDAPFVGTLYLSPGPGKADFIKAGEVVDAGAKVCIVEAMKLFNEITAPCRCKIIKVLVKDGDAVEKGQKLIGIEEL
jgi:acetyl-CoA carboxylase biotin carboxyl carrier protein